jgi:hypothetical protein
VALSAAERAELDHLNSIAGQPVAVGGLTAEERAELDSLNAIASPSAPLGQYSQMQSLSDALRAGAQGLTFGHLPQVQGAIESGHLSGPKYEEAKKGVRKDLAAGYERNAPLSAVGQLVGSAAPLVATSALGAPMAAGALRSAILAALQGGLQNPGGDVDEPGALKKRGYQAAASGALAGLLGKLQTWSGPAAERQAFDALGPSKRDIMLARQKGNLQNIGRTVLDEGVIDNIPVSKEVLYERAGDAADLAGSRKSDIIKDLGARSGPAGMINLDDIKSRLKALLQINANHPEAAARAQRAEQFADGIGGGSAANGKLSFVDADNLRIDTGKFIGWQKINPNTINPESQIFNKGLYRVLTDVVDETGLSITGPGGLNLPALKTELDATKKAYGNLSDAKRILDNRVAREEAGRVISPSDYGVGLAAGIGSAAAGVTPGMAVARGFALGAINKTLRTYGGQFTAKQLDNMSRVLNYSPLYNSLTGVPAGIYGTYNRSNAPSMSAWGLLKSTRE